MERKFPNEIIFYFKLTMNLCSHRYSLNCMNHICWSSMKWIYIYTQNDKPVFKVFTFQEIWTWCICHETIQIVFPCVFICSLISHIGLCVTQSPILAGMSLIFEVCISLRILFVDMKLLWSPAKEMNKKNFFWIVRGFF
jgi:hypothetical protein